MRISAIVALTYVVGGVDSADDPPTAKADQSANGANFVRDVAPIFQRACLRCHGPSKQQSGYRLDRKQVALNGGDAHAPNIVPGKSAGSPLIAFVSGTGDLVMPPTGKRLTPEEVATIKAWIDAGADWPAAADMQDPDKSTWWALRAIQRPIVPEIPEAANESSSQPVLNPIDAFVRSKLIEKGLRPSPPASATTLIRRVYFDLIGLPPTPDEVREFVRQSKTEELEASVAPAGKSVYERLVDRLLASPRYGERWARHWMDAAHFAETHGHDQDRIREHAWPYRDYLIASLNADKPYARFVEEQVAGDTLFPDDPQATLALGFLAAGPWDESSLRDIREDTLDRQVARYIDRDDMVATVMNNFCSVTVQCARCHDHKFDPISQKDHYALQAVFAGVERANRAYDIDPQVTRRRRELLAGAASLKRREPVTMAKLQSPTVRKSIKDWEAARQKNAPRWSPINIVKVLAMDGSTLTVQPDGSILAMGKRPDSDTYVVVTTPATAHVTAVLLEVLPDSTLPQRGPGRADNGNLHLTEFEVLPDVDKPKRLPIRRATADFNQADWDIGKSIDGVEATAWGIYPRVSKPHRAVFELQQTWTNNANTRLRLFLKQRHGRGHLIGRFRLSTTDAMPPLRFDALPDSVAAILAIAPEKRTELQWLELAIHRRSEEIEQALAVLPKPQFVFAAASDFEPDGSHRPPPGPRPVHRLNRGDIRQPRELAAPGTLSCISHLPARFELGASDGEAVRRVALAKWITDRSNPLTWRSIVNRIWHHHFGRGLVATPNDFGKLGDLPSHPELLDWLATEFRDGGGSFKSLHRLIVTSATYRQQSLTVPEYANSDSENRLLWRMNRTRLDAECVRDAILAISGRLDLRMGGPSDRQFDLQPGIHVTPLVNYSKFDLDSPAGRRRGVYRFLFRTLPDPLMETLDCPAGDQIVAARVNSVTVQQALALWNDAFVARQCEHMAKRFEAAAATPMDRVAAAAFSAWSRPAKPEELADLVVYTQKHGFENLCRVLVNANEFMFVN